MAEFKEEKREKIKRYFVQSDMMKETDEIIDRVGINVGRTIRGQWLYLTNERMICPLRPLADDINIPYRRIVEIKKRVSIIPPHWLPKVWIYYDDEESGERKRVAIQMFKTDKWIEFFKEKGGNFER